MRIGPYEALEEIGLGGAGVVYRGRSPDGHEVAIKLCSRLDATARARFEREVRLSDSLGEGFVPLLDSGSCPLGPYLVMPFLAGGSLRPRLRRGALLVAETVALAQFLARTLGEAHARGIVHRDLKPENVLFDASDVPWVADLGLAKHFAHNAAGASQSVSITQQGSAVGTAAYVPAEQLSDARSVGPAADVFAIGAILYECLAGRPAFRGASMVEVLGAVEQGRVEPLRVLRPDAPAWLASVIERALARDAAHRPVDGRALAAALAEGEAPRGTRGRGPVIALLALGTVLVGAGALALLEVPRASPTPTTSPSTPSGDGPGGGLGGGPAARDARTEADRLVSRASSELALGEAVGALADLSLALERAPLVAAIWLARGDARETTADDAGAALDFTRAVELEPLAAQPRIKRAGARMATRDLDGAIADLTQAIALDPRSADALALRAHALGHQTKYDRAHADLKRAFELDRSCALAYYARGGLELDGPRRLRDYDRALELDPLLIRVRQDRMKLRRLANEAAGATADRDILIERSPASPIGWTQRGADRMNARDFAGARADLAHAVLVSPRYAPGWAYRGRNETLDPAGDKQAAGSYVARAVALDPGVLAELDGKELSPPR